ncbi:hypothetical protein J6590_099673 [Homalodisca vitripennis]|nr:hypothetical protein J6590_007406 [Homalodisca vitripennis]KAG8333974.1 hypothetical protein J6590_099673 [Homalodisca vitripennis]
MTGLSLGTAGYTFVYRAECGVHVCLSDRAAIWCYHALECTHHLPLSLACDSPPDCSNSTAVPPWSCFDPAFTHRRTSNTSVHPQAYVKHQRSPTGVRQTPAFTHRRTSNTSVHPQAYVKHQRSPTGVRQTPAFTHRRTSNTSVHPQAYAKHQFKFNTLFSPECFKTHHFPW